MFRFISLALVALLAAVGLVACGGGGGGSSDEDQIRGVVDRALITEDPTVCEDLATANFIKVYYSGSIDQCKKDVENTSDNPDSVEVANISVSGEKATADVSVIGGPNDGEKLSTSFVKEGDQWKLDNAAAAPASTDTTASGAPTGTAPTGTATTANGEDALTALFFTTIREQVKKKGLSDAVADCIVAKMRASITPQELEQIKAGKRPASLSQKASAAGSQCAQEAISGQ
jgi:hypothetical protein